MLSRFGRRLVLAGLVLALGLGLAGAPKASAGGFLSPSQYMNTYYSLINSRNFAAAYAEWTNPPQTYEQFVAGYGDTQSVQGYFGGLQPGDVNNLVGGVPAVLYGYRTNGSVAAFSGCYFVAYNGGAIGMAQWLLTGSNNQPMGWGPCPPDPPTKTPKTPSLSAASRRNNTCEISSN